MSNSTLVLTGAYGFVARHLLSALLAGNVFSRFILIDDCTSNSYADLYSFLLNQKLINLDNYHFVRVEEKVQDISVKDFIHMYRLEAYQYALVHFAANTGVQPSILDPLLDFNSNMLGTFNMLTLARLVPPRIFLFASSGAPIGVTSVLPIHENIPTRPISPYGASKSSCEQYINAFSDCFGFNSVILRFSNLYGPGSLHKSSVVAKMIKDSLSRGSISIFGTGMQTRDFLYIDDLISLITRVLDLPDSFTYKHRLFQVGSGVETTILSLASIISSNLAEYFAVTPPSIIHEDSLQGDVPRNYADISRVSSTFQWKPLTSLKTGVHATLSYFATSRKSL